MEPGTFVYLLDETLELEKVGLVSTNMAELLVKGITELSYRACAAQVSEMTGQSISRAITLHTWLSIVPMQWAYGMSSRRSGRRPVRKRRNLRNRIKRRVHGKKEVPVLFEEADGVYISLHGKDRKQSGKRKNP